MKRTALVRKTPLRRRGPRYAKVHARTVAARPARKAEEFARVYHSDARVTFVKSLPCAACGVVGYSVNAHVGTEGKGGSRKANFDQITPLCRSRTTGEYDAGRKVLKGVTGCHERSHWSGLAAIGWTQDTADAAAAKTEAAWRARRGEA